MTARSFEYAQLQEGRKMGGVAGYGLRRAVIDDQGEIKAILQSGEQRLIRGDRVVFVHGPLQEVQTVRRIFHMFLHGGTGQGEIADTLNDEGIAGENGRPWSSCVRRQRR